MNNHKLKWVRLLSGSRVVDTAEVVEGRINHTFTGSTIQVDRLTLLDEGEAPIADISFSSGPVVLGEGDLITLDFTRTSDRIHADGQIQKGWARVR